MSSSAHAPADAPAGSAAPPSELHVLNRRVQLLERTVDAMKETGFAISRTLELQGMLVHIMDTVRELMDCDRATLYIVDSERRELWSVVAQGLESREIRMPIGAGLAGHVAESGVRLNVTNAYEHPMFDSSWDLQTGYVTRSMLCVPVTDNQDTVRAVLQAMNKRQGVFTPEDEIILESLGSQVAVALSNAKLYENLLNANNRLLAVQRDLKQKMWELDLLYDIERKISSARDLPELLDSILAKAMSIIRAEAGSILLVEQTNREMYFKSALGEKGAEVKKFHLPVGKGIAGWVAESRQPLLVLNVEKDERHDPTISKSVGFPSRSIICVPLVYGESLIGALELINKIGDEAFTQGDLKLLTLIGAQVAKAVHSHRARDEMEKTERLSALGQMLSSLMHDLKTPMTILSGYVQLMALEDDPKERARYEAAVLKQVDALGRMTREVMAFARGEKNILLRRTLLNTFFDDIREHLEREFMGSGVRLEMDIQYNQTAIVDESKIRRMIFNLARNAREAMAEKGGVFRIQVNRDKNDLVMRFSDNGPGIPESIRPRLFQSFVSEGKRDGTGLGLAIVKRIVQEHQGDIAVESGPTGTTFTIRMAALPAEEQTPAPAGH